MITHNSCSAISLARALDITPLGAGRFKHNFKITSDETGRGTNSLIGTYDGVCTLIPAGEIHDVVTAVRCWWNNRGVELHAVAQRSQVIILRQPVAQGVATDPMARDELTRFTIPTGAAIVAAPKN